MKKHWRPEADLAEAVRTGVRALAEGSGNPEPEADALEVAVMERGTRRRTFRRVPAAEVADLVGTASPAGSVAPADSSAPDADPGPGAGSEKA